jgi:hypothetical protein
MPGKMVSDVVNNSWRVSSTGSSPTSVSGLVPHSREIGPFHEILGREFEVAPPRA